MRQLVLAFGAWLWSWWVAGGAAWLLFFAVELGAARRGVRLLPRLGDVLPDTSEGACPPVTVVVAARNEEGSVAAATRSILRSDYPRLQVVVVDDRSDDRTPEILTDLAAGEPRLECLRVQDLPPGWLGKNHALQRGSERARGEWLLFTDADVRFGPSTIRRAVALARRDGYDHVTAIPALEAPGLWLRLFLAWFSLVFSLWQRPWLANRADRSTAMGIGAFNLVRTRVYWNLGGHAALPLAVADDITLGRRIKAAGYRQLVVTAGGQDESVPPLLAVQWYPDLPSAVRGMEKNAFAMFNFQAAPLLGWITLGTVVAFWPLLAVLMAPGWHRLPWLVVLLVASASYGAAGRQALGRFPLVLGLLYPLAQCLLAWTVLRSAVLTLMHGGVRWRDTFYPLEELRRAQLGVAPPR